MAAKKRITIKKVAAVAGVSTQTVSRVINNRPDVASTTRKKVQQIIEELGYQPSALARSLIRQRSYTIGIVTADLHYAGLSRTLQGITDKAQAEGYSLLLKALPTCATQKCQPALKDLLSRQVDGIIWTVPEVDHNRDWLQGELPNCPVPILFLTMHMKDTQLPVIAIDNYMGACRATQHLLEQGYRRIGHISGPLAWWEARQRKAGWEETLSNAGINIEGRHWIEGDWSCQSGETLTQQLLRNYPEMDAVFVANDHMALSLLLVAQRKGIRIPRDLGVVGFDGLPETEYFTPPLTTVHQDQQQLGITAIDHIIDMINAHQKSESADQPVKLLLEPKLIIRESSALSSCNSVRNT